MKRALLILAVAAACFSFLFLNVGQAQVQPGWPKTVTIGTASIGGVYFILAGGFSKILHDKVGVMSSTEVTGGPVHNTQLVNAQQTDFGFATAAPLWEGWTGEGWAKGKKHQNMRVIFSLYPSYVHFYGLKRSGIKNLFDLKGKSLGTGPAGGTPSVYAPKILEVAGVKPGKIVNGSIDDLNSQIKDGMLDVQVGTFGLPLGFILEMETTHELNLFGVPKAVAEKVSEKYPAFQPAAIPKGSYRTNKNYDIETSSLWNFAIVHKDAPDSFIYEVVKKSFENVDILISAHAAAKQMKPEDIISSPIPLHPGAVKFYQEKGIRLPEKIIPPK